MTALGHHYSVYYRKMLVKLWYMLNRTLKTNVEPRWPLKSNLELRWPPFVCHVIWAVFATRNTRTFLRSEDSEPFVRRTSRMKKNSVPENTYVRNGPVEYAQYKACVRGIRRWQVDFLIHDPVMRIFEDFLLVRLIKCSRGADFYWQFI